jgi:mono/diheme cytochrome c family protein
MIARLFALAAVVSLSAGCGYSRRSAPLVGPMQLNAEEQKGQLVFYRHCNECHPQGEAGLGPSLNDKALPKLGIKSQVRHALPPMPKFDDSMIAEADLDALTSYVDALHRHE